MTLRQNIILIAGLVFCITAGFLNAVGVNFADFFYGLGAALLLTVFYQLIVKAIKRKNEATTK